MEIQVNFIAVFAAAVASMALGFFWYSPVLLGKPWMKLKGYTESSLKAAQKKMGPLYLLSFILALVAAYVLTHVMAMSMAFYQMPKLETGLMSAFFMWLGFAMPVQATGTIFGDKKWALFSIDTGYQFASLIVMGVVLALVG